MRAVRLSVAALAAAAVASPAPTPPASSPNTTTIIRDACATGLYPIVARGSAEPAGAGVTGLLADRVVEQINGSRVAPLLYPASLTNPIYNESEGAGIQAMHTAVEQYAKACPGSKLVIMGYSQGAQVSADAFCGGANAGFVTPKALPARLVQDNVVAIVLFGDPTRSSNATYNRGTNVSNGIFERDPTTVQVCRAYADRLVSYCDKGDIYCDRGEDRLVHGSYVTKYGDEAVQYVVDKFRGSASQPAGSGNSTPPSTPPSTLSSSPPSSSSSITPASDAGATSAASSASNTGLHLALWPAAAMALLQML